MARLAMDASAGAGRQGQDADETRTDSDMQLLQMKIETERMRQELGIARGRSRELVRLSSRIPPRWQLLLPPDARPATLERPVAPRFVDLAQQPPSQLGAQRFYPPNNLGTASSELTQLQNTGDEDALWMAAMAKGEETREPSAVALKREDQQDVSMAEMLAAISVPHKRRLGQGDEESEAVQAPAKIARRTRTCYYPDPGHKHESRGQTDLPNTEEEQMSRREDRTARGGAAGAGGTPSPSLLLRPPSQHAVQGQHEHQTQTWTYEAIEARANKFRLGAKRMAMRTALNLTTAAGDLPPILQTSGPPEVDRPPAAEQPPIVLEGAHRIRSFGGSPTT